ncbi:DUF397 domain-containing protein [Nocardiopsis composta]|uniref:DUF397 domain-containing protein n=1 Tax=Nocardiopsis composta TaxID=157465 RepID=A0A7W8VDY2_9ACTN|nr:DUF397 domain-containing protein [Nocardiopsis composta]MBB5432354.1 hypothetical protein [Nocardiopsis composta]
MNTRFDWKKSSYSHQKGACAEVAADGHRFLVRDSKHPSLGCLGFPAAEWRAFLGRLKSEGRPGQG